MAVSGPALSLIVPVRDPATVPAVLSTLEPHPGLEVVLVAPTAVAYSGMPVVRVEPATSTPHGYLVAGLGAATGESVCFLDPDAALLPGAIAALMAAMTDGVDVVYSDERIAGRDFAKPDFSPERLRSNDYLGSLVAYRSTIINGIGGVREGIAGAELYDLALRASLAAASVVHIGSVLVESPGTTFSTRWGIEEATTRDSLHRVLEQHLAATGGGEVDEVGLDGIHRTRRTVVGSPLVSIVIPTRGTRAVVRGVDRCMVVEAVRSIVDKSTYDNLEFVIVIDDVADESVRAELRAIAGEAVRFVVWERPFSFSEKMNLGVLHARGELVMLLNDDVELITPGWLEPMIGLAQREDAGMVGAMLYFEDDSIQHAGHAYYRLDVTHIGLHSERGAAGPFGAFLVDREVAGDTCACVLMRKSVFLEAGGFSTLLPGNFNDVDLCMKVTTLGYQSYWTPYAELYHFESRSRDPRVAKSEIDTAWGRWEDQFWASPFWPTDPHEVFHRADRP